MASWTEVGASLNKSQGFVLTGKDWLSLVERASKYGALEASGTEVSTTTSVTEPLSLPIAFRQRGREPLASLSTQADRSGKCALMSTASR